MRTRALFCGLSLMMATLGFVACTEEHVENITNEDNNNGNTNAGDDTKLIPMTFTAVGSSCSRTELQPDNNNEVYWSPEDCICVFTKDGKEFKFVTDIDKVSSTASFHGEIEESDSYIAYYPYPKSSNHTLYLDGNELAFYVPTEQKALNGGFDTSLNPSYAVADSENKLLFKNLCCLMKFTFTGEGLGEVRKISITANNNMPLSQIVDYNLETKVCACRNVNAAYPSTLVSDNFENGGTYYFVIPPFEGALEKGFKISFYNESGVEVWSKSTKTNIPLTAGKILNIGTIEVQKDVDYEIAEDGTYLVYKASGLKAWANKILDYNNTDENKWKIGVRLMNDITFGENEYWTPVGNTSKVFKGIFDGNGKTIRGLKIGKKGNTDFRNALFGRMGRNAVIKDLTVESPVCYGETNLAVLAGTCEDDARIVNCHITNATLECTAGGSTGIICGQLDEATIEGCTVSGTITGIGVNKVGGLAGEVASYTNILCSSFEGNVTGNGSYYGGLVGYMSGTAQGCYAVASVSGNDYTGGLLGYHGGYDIALTASYFKGNVTCNTSSRAGMLLGYDSAILFEKNAYYCQDGGDVSAAVGNKNFEEFVKIENNLWDAAIEDMNSKIGDTYKYKYVWDGIKQHPVLQATE